MNKSILSKIVLLALLCCATALHAQKEPSGSFYGKLKDIDLSQVINPDSIVDDTSEKFKRPEPLGFIGENYQRFQIHFTSFRKSDTDPYTYTVKGKTKVNNTICDFTGTLKIVSALYDNDGLMEDIGFPDYKAGTVKSNIEIFEDKLQQHSGNIKGTLTTSVVFDGNGKLYYEALMLVADGYSNNQFSGYWTSYTTGRTKKCNWGDFRIPDSGPLDFGAGEFGVSEEYINNGWQSYHYSYCCGPDNPQTKEAQEQEFKEWWN